MNPQARLSSAADGQSQPGSGVESPDSSVLMTCDLCGLVGGPFAVAEAAHLRAVHDRLHHGIVMAA